MTPPAALDTAYELPGAREVVGRGFELMLVATGQIRRVSLYFGGLFVAFLGPLIVLTVVMILTAPPQVRDLADLLGSSGGRGTVNAIRDPGWAGALLFLIAGLYVGLPGVGLVAVEGGIVGIALLAGQRLGRPITLRHALIRSRQVFWRAVRAAFLLGLITGVAQAVAGATAGATNLPEDAATVLALLASTLAATPFAYSQTGVVLGDVGARESIRRSVRLFRARPRTALVIALFPAVFSGMIQLWALAAGGEVLVLVGQVAGLGIGPGALPTVLTFGLLMAATAATGSLFFTLGALFAAPQVVAFLGLTHYAGGLDRSAPRQIVPNPAGLATAGVAPAPVAYGAPPRLVNAELAQPPMLVLQPGRPGLAALALAPSVWVQPAGDPGAGFHWVTRGMSLAIIAGGLLALAGIVGLAGRIGQG